MDIKELHDFCLVFYNPTWLYFQQGIFAERKSVCFRKKCFTVHVVQLNRESKVIQAVCNINK